VLNRIKVGDIYALGRLYKLLIGRVLVLIIAIVFLYIHAKDAYIESVHLLKQSNCFGSIVYLSRRGYVVVRALAGGHLEMMANDIRYLEEPRAVRDNTDRNGLASVKEPV
jgi:hypothetical protein